MAVVATSVTARRDDVTHLVVAPCPTGSSSSSGSGSGSGSCAAAGLQASMRSIKYLRAISSGNWIVTPAWVSACLTRNSLVPEDQYEVAGDR
jgi:hypothetical protein